MDAGCIRKLELFQFCPQILFEYENHENPEDAEANFFMLILCFPARITRAKLFINIYCRLTYTVCVAVSLALQPSKCHFLPLQWPIETTLYAINAFITNT